jgi:hypothetical protein
MLITSSVDYVRWTQTTAIYMDKLNLTAGPDFDEIRTQYEFLGVLDEAGELAGIFKRVIRDGVSLDRNELLLELGDLAWYLARIHYDHADHELDTENSIYPVVKDLGLIEKTNGMTCFDITILVAEALKPHFKDKASCAKFIFGPAPKSTREIINRISEGIMSASSDPTKHFVFSMHKRIEDSVEVGILMHLVSEAQSMEAVLDWCALCYKHDLDIIDVLQTNVNKLESRKERGVLSGKGSNR